jgi:hypothetical protein
VRDESDDHTHSQAREEEMTEIFGTDRTYIAGLVDVDVRTAKTILNPADVANRCCT